MKNKLLLLVMSVTLLLSYTSTFAQAPVLGRAADFVLFTATGAITNNGISQITGNVGSNVGSSTGFGNVNGVMNDQNGASLQAATDLMLAYDQLNSAIATRFPAPLLGNGDTLKAGVYKINAVTTLSGNLYLDAEGDANAVFIFQIEAAFSTNVAAKVKLLNGAQSCNIFWKIEGLVSIAAKTFMRGNIVAHNAAINLNVNDTLEGRALSTTGAVAIDGVFAYIPSGCGSVTLNGPAAPPLGSASCYSIFSSNGPVTNSGVTYGKGDIGTNVGLTTGYDPLFIDGTVHPIPDFSTAACAADLLNAYNIINVIPFDIELLYPAQFGRNLVLTPHTYLLNAATSFTDTLYLNAEGNGDAVFVIRIKGALSTSVGCKVLLINGTQSKNVYWQVDGAVSISDNSVFHGTIICNNGAIALNSSDSLYGRALTTNGTVSTAAIVSSIQSECLSALPVTWLYFTGNAVEKNVLLKWATTNEINNGFFTIEKSSDGYNFSILANINSINASTGSEQRYSTIDLQPFAITYYRISQTDRDGQKKYFRTIKVKMNQPLNGMEVQNYEEGNFINVNISNALPAKALLSLISMDGRVVSSQAIILSKEMHSYKISKNLMNGIFLVNISTQGKTVYSDKILLNK